MTLFRALPVLLLAAACTPSSPLKGPGLNDDGSLRIDADGPFLVVVTHTKIAKGERKAFNEHVEAVDEQLDAQSGFVARSLRAEMFGRERWTMTVWTDELSMLDFVTSGAHVQAMQDTATVLDGLHTASFEVSKAEMPPTWDQALAELDIVEPDPAF